MENILTEHTMIRIAMVEDCKDDADLLAAFLARYEKEERTQFALTHYKSGLSFLENYHGDEDIIFMDIDLPEMNGLDVSKKLREKDATVVLVFLTNLAKYAIKGYAVNAFDFIAKPVTYYSFSTMLVRAIKKAQLESKEEVVISSGNHVVRLELRSIIYVEVFSHQLIYHTDSGDYREWRSLSSIEPAFLAHGFAKGSASSLINLRRIEALNGEEVTLENGAKIYLSRGQKKDFAAAFTAFLSGE